MSFAESDALLSDEELATAQDQADLLNAQEACDRVEAQSQDVSSGKAEEDRVKFAGRNPKMLLSIANGKTIGCPASGTCKLVPQVLELACLLRILAISLCVFLFWCFVCLALGIINFYCCTFFSFFVVSKACQVK